MFGKRFTLFRLLGFEVRLDPSWLVLAVLITWTLAREWFPSTCRGLPPSAYWWMGAAGALGLFASIVFHELSHSLVARACGLPMKGITLFIFGGVAEMDREPSGPGSEFWMAAAGPASSICLALAFLALRFAGARGGWPAGVTAVLGYLALMNGLLAGFNLLPGFPLDGGRILRAALWALRGDFAWATRVASRAGAALGGALFVLGLLSVVGGNYLGGLWWFLIGMFLRSASRSSYRQMIERSAFEGAPVRRFMRPDPVSVPPSLPVASLVQEYIYRYHHKMFPVVQDGKLLGCVSTREVKDLPREEWARRTVGEIAMDCSGVNTVSPDDDAMRAISLMHRGGLSRLLVVEEGRLAGIVSLKDMLAFLSLKLDLEGEE